MATTTEGDHLRQRLLRDVLELCRSPYPDIAVHTHDESLTELCLVLSPPGWRDMHLTVKRLERYPLGPPTIQMNSDIEHPNVFGEYICASILNTTEGYTPAYTPKGVFIQLLSFFGSEGIEQQYNYHMVDLDYYRM
jgi:ubiquitin-protein ligase